MKKKLLSIILALALCVGLAAPALAAEEQTIIAIPGLQGYKCTLYDYADDDGVMPEADVSELAFTMSNAPSQYYVQESDNGNKEYMIRVPLDCYVKVKDNCTDEPYTGGDFDREFGFPNGDLALYAHTDSGWTESAYYRVE